MPDFVGIDTIVIVIFPDWKSLSSLVSQVHPQRDVSTCQRPKLFDGYRGHENMHKTNFLHFPQGAVLLLQGDLRALHTVLDKPFLDLRILHTL